MRLYTQTDHFLVTRDGDLRFEKIPADGSSKMCGTTMESLEPFDYGCLEPFSMAYLSGFMADKYDVDAKELKPRIHERIHASVDKNLRSTVNGYASVSKRSLNVNIHNSEINYALLPVWVLNTRHNGNLYTFTMNGQTGKLVGDLPIDWARAACLGAAIFAGLAALLIAMGFGIGLTSETFGILQIVGIIGIVVGLLSFITYLPMFNKSKKKRGE